MVTPQKRALTNYRRRLGEQGIARFEVLGLEADRALIRSLAKRMAERDTEAGRLRRAVSQALGSNDADTGGIVAALRRSPLVGAELNLTREETPGRALDL